MPKFAILRLAKLRTRSAVSNAGAHNHRTRPQANADVERTPLNREFVASPLSLLERVNARLEGLKFRKDAVVASELVLSASPEFFNDLDTLTDWVRLNLKWLRDKHGSNLVSCVLHLDESTPHLHAVIVPICPDGKLACKRYWGGPKDLVRLQTEYAAAMKPLGLSRGIEGSHRPTDATVARWRGSQALAEAATPVRAMPVPELPPPPPLPNRLSLATLTADEWRQLFVDYGKRVAQQAAKAFAPVLMDLDTMVKQFTALNARTRPAPPPPPLEGDGAKPPASLRRTAFRPQANLPEDGGRPPRSAAAFRAFPPHGGGGR